MKLLRSYGGQLIRDEKPSRAIEYEASSTNGRYRTARCPSSTAVLAKPVWLPYGPDGGKEGLKVTSYSPHPYTVPLQTETFKAL